MREHDVMQELALPERALRKREILEPEIVDRLSIAYDLGDWLEWRRTPKGRTNVSFYLTTQSGRYVLRRSTARKSLAGLEFELRLMDFLRQRGYPAPEIVPTRAGTRYVEHDDSFYLLTAFISGTPCDPEDPAHLLASARGLGLYHRLVRDLPGPHYTRPAPDPSVLEPERFRQFSKIHSVAEQFLTADEQSSLRDAFSFLRCELSAVAEELAGTLPGLSRLFIHGSFGRSALLFDGDALAAVLDYDRAGYELRCTDLAYTTKAFCRIYDEDQDDYRIGLDMARYRNFMAGYQQQERLPRADAEALPLLSRSQRLRKVLTKSGNFLRKHAVKPQEEKDLRKLASILEREALRLRWLKEHADELLDASTIRG
jgi:Ser/Thr protein kinase RdoA (MazF antagonist)